MSLINTNFGAIGSLNLPEISKPRATESSEGFGNVLKNAISNVNQLSGGAEQQLRDGGGGESRRGFPAHDAGAQQDRQRLSRYREDAVLTSCRLRRQPGSDRWQQ